LPITVGFFGRFRWGHGAGERFRLEIRPDNDSLALVETRKEKRNKKERKPFTSHRIWTSVGGHPAHDGVRW
jgi:hypothetical protein